MCVCVYVFVCVFLSYFPLPFSFIKRRLLVEGRGNAHRRMCVCAYTHVFNKKVRTVCTISACILQNDSLVNTHNERGAIQKMKKNAKFSIALHHVPRNVQTHRHDNSHLFIIRRSHKTSLVLLPLQQQRKATTTTQTGRRIHAPDRSILICRQTILYMCIYEDMCSCRCVTINKSCVLSIFLSFFPSFFYSFFPFFFPWFFPSFSPYSFLFLFLKEKALSFSGAVFILRVSEAKLFAWFSVFVSFKFCFYLSPILYRIFFVSLPPSISYISTFFITLLFPF